MDVLRRQLSPMPNRSYKRAAVMRRQLQLLTRGVLKHPVVYVESVILLLLQWNAWR
jgi:hypothetical protein